MRLLSGKRVARAAAFGCGLLLVAGALHAWRVSPSSGSVVGADVRVAAVAVGPVVVREPSPFVDASDLRAGDPPGGASGRIVVTNEGDRAAALAVRARPSIGELDDLLRMRLSTGGRSLFEGRLGRLRAWTRTGLRLAPAQKRTLRVRIWFDSSDGHGYQGLSMDVNLELGSGSSGASP